MKFNQHRLNLGRIDLCFSHSNDLNHTSKSFDVFLVDSRSKIQNYTTTRHIRLQDFPDGKILKVNRRNNSIHYRVYQKEQSVRFEIELKHRIKKQLYYGLKFPLSKFYRFTGMKVSNQSEREKLIFYFSQLQKLNPIVKMFSNIAFRSYVCFPFVDCTNPSGKSWVIEVLAAEELFCFPYPYQLPKSFLHSVSKNDLRLKVHLMKSLAVSDKNKTIDLEEFFNTINIRNDPLIQIKKNLIRLLSELVENRIIQNEVEILLKSGKKRYYLIKNLTTSDITRRIKYIQLH